ncbi:MAG TPA: N-acetylmuramoyl-L-alanine amidase, partial [Nakamurella sp.]
MLLQAQFSAAATEFGVPTAVLLAVGYEESRWESHGDLPSVEGGFGAMHLTDTAAVGRRDGQFDGDGRGAAEAPVQSEPRDAGVAPPREHEATADTLPAAAALLGVTPDSLRREPEQNLRGGAALLARYQREVTGDLSTDPGRWYPAVARYSGALDAATARAFADDVFGLIRDGVARTTYGGQQVRLAADPDIRPDRAAVARLGLPEPSPRAAAAECPRTLACDFIPAAYAQTDPAHTTSYGNYDMAVRPRDGDAVRYIVIHDTEGSYDGTLQEFANPTFGASAHYLIRSGDGHVTQSVPTRDVAWHAG